MVSVYKKCGKFYAEDVNDPNRRVELRVSGGRLVAPSGKQVAMIGDIEDSLEKIAPKLYGAVKLVKGFLNKLNIGGVDQDRFFITYFDIRNIFSDAGYLVVGSDWHEAALTRHKIRKTQVRNNSADNYYPEFQRLRAWVIDVMNHANPGLGTDFGAIFTEFKMANKGQIYSAYEDIIKTVVDAIPPNNYIVGTLQEVVNLGSIEEKIKEQQTGLTEKLIDGYTVVTDAAGAVREIRNAAGQLLSPGTPEYKQVLDDSTKQAGFGMTEIGLGVAALFAIALMTGGQPRRKMRAR